MSRQVSQRFAIRCVPCEEWLTATSAGESAARTRARWPGVVPRSAIVINVSVVIVRAGWARRSVAASSSMMVSKICMSRCPFCVSWIRAGEGF